MNAQEVVRQWLMGNGLMVADECLVSDKDKIYQVIAAVHGEQSEEDSFFFELGRKLVEKRDPLLYEFAGKKIKELNDIVDSLQNAESEEGKRKLQECLERIERYREVIEACR
jgi:tRNA (adenine22-N1)-methyltransferase